MTGLQTATDIVALAFMGILLIIMFSLLIAVLVIKHKINNLHTMIQERVEAIERMAMPLEWIVNSFKKK